MSHIDIKEVVREKYGQAALARAPAGSSCCGAAPAREPSNPITSNLYDDSADSCAAGGAVLASLGCGNPTALAELKPGETVLDLGRAAASTCCCRRAASAPRARPTAST